MVPPIFVHFNFNNKMSRPQPKNIAELLKQTYDNVKEDSNDDYWYHNGDNHDESDQPDDQDDDDYEFDEDRSNGKSTSDMALLQSDEVDSESEDSDESFNHQVCPRVP